MFDGVRQIVNNLRAIGMFEDKSHLKDLVLASDDTVLQFAIRELIADGGDGLQKAIIDEVLEAIGKAVKVEDIVAGYREHCERRVGTTAVLISQSARPTKVTKTAAAKKKGAVPNASSVARATKVGSAGWSVVTGDRK